MARYRFRTIAGEMVTYMVPLSGPRGSENVWAEAIPYSAIKYAQGCWSDYKTRKREALKKAAQKCH